MLFLTIPISRHFLNLVVFGFTYSTMFFYSQIKRSSSPTLLPPSTMPFSVTDILQPMDADPSAAYKRSIEMAHALSAATSSSAYPVARPSSSTTSANLCNPSFGPSTVHHSYYGPSSTNSQYYDYSTSFPNSTTTAGQYSPSSCWYGPAASKRRIFIGNSKFVCSR